MHHEEAKRAIATGRMAHLCLSNSLLYVGEDFSSHPEVNALLADPKLHPVILFPGKNSLDLAAAKPAVPAGKELVVFVLDGTWRTAPRIRRLSRNLHSLPMIGFTPTTASAFTIRKQPEAFCYATIEAIHTVIGYLAPRETSHHNMLEVFQGMVDQQLDFERNSGV